MFKRFLIGILILSMLFTSINVMSPNISFAAGKTTLQYAFVGNQSQPTGFSSGIRINSLGFLPNSEKRASISTSCSSFSLKRTSDGAVIFNGNVTGPIYNSDTQENLYTADFSTVTTEGSYYLDVSGVGRTEDFVISNNAYNWAYYMAMKGMYLFRCGTPVSYTDWRGNNFVRSSACHQTGMTTTLEEKGGWHDANDMNKYIVDGAWAAYMIMKAYEDFNSKVGNVKLDIPESSGTLPDMLAEAKWELDWMFKMQKADGSVYTRITGDEPNHYLHESSTNATANFCAAMAVAKRIYQAYDTTFADKCWNAAVNAYNYLAANTSYLVEDTQNYPDTGGNYDGTDNDERIWAFSEMWVSADTLNLSNKNTYLSAFETKANAFNSGYNGGKVLTAQNDRRAANYGMIDYYMHSSSSRNSSLVNTIQNDIMSAANKVVAERNGYGRSYWCVSGGGSGGGQCAYDWGSNRDVMTNAYLLNAANKVSPNANYLNTAVSGIDYIYGRNYFNKTFQTGVGFNEAKNIFFPNDPGVNGYPLPGLLINGPCSFGSSGKDWHEGNPNPWQYTEPAIDAGAALIYALAMFVNGDGGSAPPPTSGPLDRTGWTVTASSDANGDVPSRAIDGNTTTRWTTGSTQSGNEWYKIDLGSSKPFNKVVLDSTNSNGDYGTNYAVYVSDDGTNWGSVIATGVGSTVTTINFTSQTKRYIKINQTGSASSWWSVHELNVYSDDSPPPPTSGPLDRTGWTVTASSDANGDVPSRAIDGNTTTRWTTGKTQSGNEWYKIDLGSSSTTFNKVVLDSTNSNGDYCRNYAVYVSDDGTNWGSAIATGAGSAVTTITFTSKTKRYIKINQTGSASSWWSVNELNVYN